MTKREQLEPGDEHPRLRLDIHLNLEGLGEADGPLDAPMRGAA